MEKKISRKTMLLGYHMKDENKRKWGSNFSWGVKTLYRNKWILMSKLNKRYKNKVQQTKLRR